MHADSVVILVSADGDAGRASVMCVGVSEKDKYVWRHSRGPRYGRNLTVANLRILLGYGCIFSNPRVHQ